MKKRVSLLIASGVLSLVAAEIGVRSVGIERISPHRIVDRVLYVQKPWAEYSQKHEGHAVGRYNRYGLRDLDIYDREKPGNVVRILIFGDSHTEALQLDQELDFDNRLESLLRGSTLEGPPVEVLNFGLSGTGTADQLLRFEKQGVAFGPDYVLLAFYVGNDFRNNSFECEGDSRRPYFEATETGVRLSRKFGRWRHRGIVSWLRQSSALFNGAYKTVSYWMSRERESWRPGTEEVSERGVLTSRFLSELESEEYAQAQLFLEEYPAHLEGCVGISLQLIEEFGRTAQSFGAQFAVLVLPMDLQVQGDMLDRSVVERGDLDWEKPTRLVESFSRDEGIPYVSVLKPLRNYYERTGRNAYGFDGALHGHLNSAGHEVVAYALRDFFCASYIECSQ